MSKKLGLQAVPTGAGIGTAQLGTCHRPFTRKISAGISRAASVFARERDRTETAANLEDLTRSMTGKDDGLALDAMFKLRMMAVKKQIRGRELFYTQNILAVAANEKRTPERRIGAILNAQEIGLWRNDSPQLVSEVLCTLPRIFKREGEREDVRENAFSAFYEITRQGGFVLEFSKQLLAAVNAVGALIHSENPIFRHLAVSSMHELHKYSEDKKDLLLQSVVEGIVSKAYKEGAEDTRITIEAAFASCRKKPYPKV